MTDTTPGSEQFTKGLQDLANGLRACKDHRLHRDITLALFFLKAINDIFQSYSTLGPSLANKYPSWQGLLEKLRVPEEAVFSKLFDQRMELGNGERLNAALQALAKAYTPFNEVFQEINCNSPRLGNEQERDELLAKLLDTLNFITVEVPPRHSGYFDMLGQGFTYLLRHFAGKYGRTSGDIVPPPEVVDLLKCLLAPKPGDEICDPACFSGSLLSELGMAQHFIYGQERDRGAWALARMNLFLHGCDSSKIELGDTIADPKLLSGATELKKFDIVVSNLMTIPEDWGAEGADADPFKRFSRGVPLKNLGEYGYIQHMVACMKPDTGRMAVIVPRGVLSRGGTDTAIRQKLIEEDRLAAVICLPKKLFLGAIIPVAVLVLSNCKAEKDKVLFIDASQDFQLGKNRNILRKEDIERIGNSYRMMQEIEAWSHVTSETEIKNNDFNLNMPHYVQMSSENGLLDIEQIGRERKELLMERVDLEKKIDQLLNI